MKKDELFDLLSQFKPDDKYIAEALNDDFDSVGKAHTGKIKLSPTKILAPIAACLAVAVGVRIAVTLKGRPSTVVESANAPAVNSAADERDTAVSAPNTAQSKLKVAKSGLEACQSNLEEVESKLKAVKSELEEAEDLAESKREAAESKLEAAKSDLEAAKSEFEAAANSTESGKYILSELEDAVNSAEEERYIVTIEFEARISELEAAVDLAEEERDNAIIELETARSEFENAANEEINSCKQTLSEKYGVPLDELKAAPYDIKWFDLDGDGSEEVVLSFKDVSKLKGMYVFQTEPNTGNTEFAAELDPEGLRGYDDKERDFSVNILKYEDENESFYYYHTIKVTYLLLHPGDITYGEWSVYKISADNGSIVSKEFLYDGIQNIDGEWENLYRVNGSEVTFEEYNAVFDKYGFIKNFPTVEQNNKQ